MDLNRKINVFISSGCGDGEGKDRYNLIRNDIKFRLESLGYVQTYIYEADYCASTKQVKSAYLDELDDSDLVIFLIDNADGVYEGVRNEYQRAKVKGKRCFYIFCDENSKEATDIEKEVKTPDSGRCQTIHSFGEFPEIVFNSLLNEIVKTYKDYCKGRLNYEWCLDQMGYQNVDIPETAVFPLEIKTSNAVFPAVIPTSTSGSASDSIVATKIIQESIGTNCNLQNPNPRKDDLSHLLESCRFLCGYVFDTDYSSHAVFGQSGTSILDEACLYILKVLTGTEAFNETFMKSLQADAGEEGVASEISTIDKIPALRRKAISAYFQGDSEECIRSLTEALELTGSEETWLRDDILIDLRNAFSHKLNNEGSMSLNSPYQKWLDESDVAIQLPVLDREISDFYEAMSSKQINESLKRPTTVTFGNDYSEIVVHLVKAMAVALLYGSLTQLIVFPKYMRDLFSFLASLYSDWSFKIKAIQYTVATKNGDLKNLKYYWNDILGNISSKDVRSIYNYVSMAEPESCRRFAGQLTVVESFGYYFDDSDYDEIMSSLLDRINAELSKMNPNIFLRAPIVNALKENVARIDNSMLVKIASKMYSHSGVYLKREAFDVLSGLDFSKLDIDDWNTIYTIIQEGFLAENLETISFPRLVERFRYRSTEREDIDSFDWAEFDSLVKLKMPGLYRDAYSLNVNFSNTKKQIDYINDQFSDIKKVNDEAESVGVRTAHAGDPYENVLQIITFPGFSFTPEMRDALNNVVAEVERSIFSPDQQNIYKASAILLVAVLSIRLPEFSAQCVNIAKRIRDADTTFSYGRDSLLSNATGQIVRWSLLLLDIAVGKDVHNNLNDFIGDFLDMKEVDQIFVFRSLYTLSAEMKVSALKIGILQSLTLFCTIGSNNHNHDVRYYSIMTLLHLHTKDNEDAILSVLMKRMDSDSPIIKSCILEHMEDFRNSQNPFVKGIIEKGRVDNNFIVRSRKLLFRHAWE